MPPSAEHDRAERPAATIGTRDRLTLARFLESRWATWGVPLAILTAASAIYWAVATSVAGLNPTWFALTGVAFLGVTAAAHAVLCRSQGSEFVIGILGSMAIRLAGTLSILGMLLFFSPVGRPGAVFNVLFWYITLTLWDLLGIAYRRMSNPSFGLSTSKAAGSSD